MPAFRFGPGRALLIDAAGTLLSPRDPVATTYAEAATRHGTPVSAADVASRLRSAMHDARALRTAPDWRGYWAVVVAESTGNHAPALLEELYDHYARPGAWRVAPGAEACARRVTSAGGRVAIVSNWDTRLRSLLTELGVADWVDAIVVSGEEGMEKPDPAIFHLACRRLGVAPAEALHVGDSRDDDVQGARAAGLHALHFGLDVAGFADLA